MSEDTDGGVDKTNQQRVVEMIQSESFSDRAIGLWAKIIVEGAIVAIPAGILVWAFHVMLPDGLFFVGTMESAIGGWAAMTLTMLNMIWCRMTKTYSSGS